MPSHEPSELAQSAIAYLEEMGGVEREEFPEEWTWVHDSPGSQGVPVAVSKGFAEDGAMTAVAFFEVRDGKFAVEPGDGWGGVAVVHDSYRKPRAFVFDEVTDFDNAVTDTDIRGLFS